MEEFNEFCDSMELLNIPMIGRTFTCYRNYNSSEVDYIRQISPLEEWINLWPYSLQFILD